MTVAEALRQGTTRLVAAGIDGAARDARHLMAETLGIAADRVSLHALDPISAEAEAAFFAAVEARSAGTPVSRILGRRLFWGRSFIVTPDVLDPRPETETLVALALEAPFESVLDLGTGSGCIVVTLLAERAKARGTGTDVSDAALQVAARNAQALGVHDRLELTRSDWFASVSGRFDLIVSNPPYIAASEMGDLAPEVRDHDPDLALTPGGDGLAAYRMVAAGAATHLVPGGRLILEIGWTQGPAVSELLGAAGFADVAVHPDLDGRDRVVSAINS